MIAKLYSVATALIIVGVVMLCQPFLLLVHVWAFPVFLVGFVLFMILDHLPSFEDRAGATEERSTPQIASKQLGLEGRT